MSASAYACLDALLGPAPFEGAVLYVAQNQPPTAGTAPGTWIQDCYGNPEQAAASLAERADGGETYAALSWFASGQGRTKAAVVAKRSISADVDAKLMPGLTAQERMHQARTLARSLPCPAIVVGSGGGFHPHVLLPDSLRVESYADPADGVQHVEVLGRALRLYLEAKARELFGADVALDHCHGAERVWRVPPGWNAKSADGARTLTADRSYWRPVTLEIPGRLEGLASIVPADLGFLVPFVTAAEEEDRDATAGGPATGPAREGQNKPPHEGPVAVANGAGEHFEVRILPQRMAERWPMRDGDQSENDFALASELARCGWSPATAQAAIRQRRAMLPDPEDRAKGEREDYVTRTVRKAYAAHPRGAEPPSLAPYVPFPLDALADAVGRYVAAGARAVGCAVEAIVLPLLCVLGAAIGNSRRIGLKRTWSEPPVIWAAIVLPSGSKKSPALDLATDSLTRRQQKALAKFKIELTQYLADHERHQAAMREWKKAGDDRDPDPPTPPKRPVAYRCKVSDTTVEALAPILEENSRGVALVRDELAAWLKSFDAYKQGRGGDRESWLSIHRAGAVLVDRKQDRAIISVPRAFVGVCGGIQPRTLRRLLTGEFFECGLPARLLVAAPPSPRKKWTDAEIPMDVEAAMGRVQERLHGIRLYRGEDDEPGPYIMRLSSEAKPLWVEFYDAFGAQQDELAEEDDVGAAFAKLEGYAARFALILCLATWAAGDEQDPPDEIDAESMRAGIVLARWFAQETERVYARFRETDERAAQRRLLAWLRKHAGPVTVRKIQRGLREYREDAEAASEAVARLVEAGLAWRVLVPPHREGGPSTRAVLLRETPPSGGDGDGTSLKGPFVAGSGEDLSPEDPRQGLLDAQEEGGRDA